MQNRLQFNAHCGCSYCYHPGKYAAGSMRYPLLKDDPAVRIHKSHLEDIKKAAKGPTKSFLGVKGSCILLGLTFFNIVWNFCIDYMHAFLLGLTKQIKNRWASDYFSKEQLNKINKRMTNIKLCRDIRRGIRSLDYSRKYKATEWRTWMLMVSLPVLRDILPEDELKSWALVVDGMYTLLSTAITNTQLERIDYNFVKFIGESEMLYGIGFITFNLHSVAHCIDSVKHSGPLWATSAFPFENGIYQFLKELNAPNGCLKQISEKWLRKYMFKHFLANQEDLENEPMKYCKSLFISRPPLKNCTVKDNITFTKKARTQVTTLDTVQNLLGKDEPVIEFFQSFVYESLFYHIKSYSRSFKTNESVVQTINNEIIQIHHAFVSEKRSYICGYKWNVDDNDFGNDEEGKPIVKHFFKVSQIVSNYVLVEIQAIKNKVVVIDTKDDLYITFLPNNYEVQ